MESGLVFGHKAEEAWLRDWSAGPKRTRWTSLPVQVGDPAPDVTLTSESGEPFRLPEAWSKGPALLIFMRHFGCGCAWERAERLKLEIQELVSAGATVIAIGQADPQRARKFKAAAGLDCAVLSDEGRRAYEAFGLLEARPSQVVYGMPEAFLRRDRKVAEDLLAARQRSGRPLVDSPWQLPGEFVIDTSGIIKLAFRSQYCADYADKNVLLAAITEAALGL